MMKTLLYTSLLYFSLCSSRTPEKVVYSGLVRCIALDLDSATQQFKKSNVLPSWHLWYWDSTVIEEIIYSYTHTDSADVTTRKHVIDHYTYTDLKTKSFYDYSSFSDTARLLKKYGINSHKGAVVFHNSYNSKQTRPAEPLPDTTIDGVYYKRYKLYTTSNMNVVPKEQIHVGYTRCDLKTRIFDFGVNWGTVQACPMTRIEYLEHPARLTFQCDFLGDTLSVTQHKVFQAWAKYAKEHPVSK